MNEQAFSPERLVVSVSTIYALSMPKYVYVQLHGPQGGSAPPPLKIRADKIQKAMARLMVDRTSFVIAHRLSTIRDADWIVVFDRGRIVEQGTWTTLQAAKGTFDRLVHGLTA